MGLVSTLAIVGMIQATSLATDIPSEEALPHTLRDSVMQYVVDGGVAYRAQLPFTIQGNRISALCKTQHKVSLGNRISASLCSYHNSGENNLVFVLSEFRPNILGDFINQSFVDAGLNDHLACYVEGSYDGIRFSGFASGEKCKRSTYDSFLRRFDDGGRLKN